MNKATDVQCGIVNHRIYREPLDGETVMQTYNDLMQHLEMDGQCKTKKGRVYGGLITSVVNDPNETLNGPYYISYTTTYNEGVPQISYLATRLSTEDPNSKIFDWRELQ